MRAMAACPSCAGRKQADRRQTANANPHPMPSTQRQAVKDKPYDSQVLDRRKQGRGKAVEGARGRSQHLLGIAIAIQVGVRASQQSAQQPVSPKGGERPEAFPVATHRMPHADTGAKVRQRRAASSRQTEKAR